MNTTPRERLLTALAHRQPDVTPWQIDLTQDARDATARIGAVRRTHRPVEVYPRRAIAEREEGHDGFQARVGESDRDGDHGMTGARLSAMTAR